MGKQRLFLGLHGGLAADGVDACLLAVTGKGLRIKVTQLAWRRQAYPPTLTDQLLDVPSSPAAAPSDRLARLAELDAPLADQFAQAARSLLDQACLAPAALSAAGAAGHVIARDPVPIELPTPPRLRVALQLPLAAGFAQADHVRPTPSPPSLACAEWLIFHDRRLSRVLVQLGALAALTFLASACPAPDALAFDAGPGTVLIDALARRHLHLPMDADGALAAKGRPCRELLVQLLAHPFLRTSPPKRTSIQDWLGVHLERLELQAHRLGCAGADLLATVTEWTARLIADAVLALTERPHEVILCGGGAHNIHLASRIRTLLSPSSTYAVPRYGLDPQSKQAAMTAILACLRLDGPPPATPPAGLW